MNKRVRLTQRRAADQTPYPGNVNQPDRTDPAWDQYHTFEQTVNHELPDMRTEWKDNPRDDIGFGQPKTAKAPTIASIRVSANKAVKLAVLMLGESVPEDIIEEQARDFMTLGNERMDRTLARFTATEKFMKADDDAADVAPEAAPAPAAVPPPAPVEPTACAAAKKSSEALVTEDKDGQVAPVASVKKAEDVKPVEKPAEDKKPDFLKDKEAKAAAVKKAEDLPVEDAAPAGDDFELQGAVEDELPESPEDDAKLASLFAGDVPPLEDEQGEVIAPVARTAKRGISKLGGQPKVASADGAPTDISSIWATAPDVSSIFNS